MPVLSISKKHGTVDQSILSQIIEFEIVFKKVSSW